MYLKLAITGLALVSSLLLAAQNDNPARQKHFNLDRKHLAIQGYDAVSYFNAKAPQKGKSEFRLVHNGVVYYFRNAANLKTFQANPGKYEPAWGGWCGHAMALRGEKVAINPLAYKIIDGRNVLFYKNLLGDALANWEKEIRTTPEGRLMEQGDQFWRSVTKS